jgi:uncharacterized membrane protein YhaH (DUF805 family)
MDDSLHLPWPDISFTQSFVRFWKKYAIFSGRASVREYWFAVVWVAIIMALLGAIDGLLLVVSPRVALGGLILVGLGGLALVVPSISMAVRRLHDTGKSGLWFLISLTGVGSIWLVVLLCMGSNPAGVRFDAPDVAFGAPPRGMQAPRPGARPAVSHPIPPDLIMAGGYSSRADAPTAQAAMESGRPWASAGNPPAMPARDAYPPAALDGRFDAPGYPPPTPSYLSPVVDGRFDAPGYPPPAPSYPPAVMDRRSDTPGYPPPTPSYPSAPSFSPVPSYPPVPRIPPVPSIPPVPEPVSVSPLALRPAGPAPDAPAKRAPVQRFCTECGRPLRPDAGWCGFCGTQTAV